MLSPEIIKKIKINHIKSNRIVNTMMAGQYKSVFRGSGIEFDEVREYTPGDEIKNIDWKVSARIGRPFIKLFQEEREIIVMLLVDISDSGKFGTTNHLKIETAAEIASILAFNAIKNNDKVGVILFADKVEKYIPPKKGTSHIWRVIKEIYTFKPESNGTRIDTAINYLGKICRKKTITFIISDFISENYIKPLKITSKKHEIISVLLSDPGDFKIPEAGLLTIKDFENDKIYHLDAYDKKTKNQFQALKINEYNNILKTFKKSNIDCIELSTSDSVIEALKKYFRYREKRIR